MQTLLATTLVGMLFSVGFGHPLGSRTFDCALQVEVTPSQIRLRYELTISELTMTTELLRFHPKGSIPFSADEAAALFAETIHPILRDGIAVTANGRPLDLTLGATRHSRSDHIYLTFELQGLLDLGTSPTTLEVRDTNYIDELGYRRLALSSQAPVTILASSVPPSIETIPLAATWELTPEEEESRLYAVATLAINPSLPSTPGDLATEGGRTESAATTAPPPLPPVTGAKDDPEHHLRDLLTSEGKGVGFWTAVLLGAFGLGMVHAIKPGHGKTLVAAYLVGQHGTIWHAFLLGIVMTLTHTGSVLFVALLLRPFAGSPWVEQGALSYWLTLLSGLLVAGLGIGLFWRRWQGGEDLLHRHGAGGHSHLPDGTIVWHNSPGGSHSHQHDHSHSHGEHHHHHHVHTHPPSDNVSLASLVTLGFSGGLVPCDDAVVLLLAAIGAGILGQAIYLLLAFSGGLAFVLVMVGILVIKIRSFATRGREPGPWIQWLQIASAAGITLVGMALCASVLLA